MMSAFADSISSVAIFCSKRVRVNPHELANISEGLIFPEFCIKDSHFYFDKDERCRSSESVKEDRYHRNQFSFLQHNRQGLFLWMQ